MKLIMITLTILFSLILTACGSDELSKNKATDIARECESKTNKPAIKTTTFDYGEIRVNTTMNKRFGDKMEKYLKFQDLGLVIIDTLATQKSNFGNKTEVFNIQLTSKAKKLLVGKVKERSGALSAKFKTCEYKFKEISEVQNLPESNNAKVKIVFERLSETPFFEENNEKQNPKEIIKTVPYRKTTDGWKLCD
ncbi:hypothetical protein [Gelidibacter mesophilus]|uniref:hypothetical protein n=1 Tax=Gelidibacter mesophilus TaxID=169050 RepID=UPI000483949F|nr:hypothetical protein [Gelidibacter mesophilus]